VCLGECRASQQSRTQDTSPDLEFDLFLVDFGLDIL
jgi:hypothetical protein